MSDATAAAMGRLPAAQHPEQPRSTVPITVRMGIEQGLLRMRRMPLCTMSQSRSVPAVLKTLGSSLGFIPKVSLDLLHSADGAGRVTG